LSPPSFEKPESLGILTLPAWAPGSSHLLSFPAAFSAGFHLVTGQVEFDSNEAEHTNNTAQVGIWIGVALLM